MRSPHGQYTEYHTSADNMDFVKPESLEGSYRLCLSVLHVLQNNRTFVNQNPTRQLQPGNTGTLPGYWRTKTWRLSLQSVMLWVLNLSDGQHSLLDIAERSGLRFELIESAAEALAANALLTESRKQERGKRARRMDNGTPSPVLG